MNETISLLARRILDSYNQIGGINHLDGANLPSKSAIGLITADLLRLLFPGFFGERPLGTSEVNQITTCLMGSVQSRLIEQISKSLEYRPLSSSDRAYETQARELTEQFLNCLPSIRELLQTDAEAALSGDPAALSKEEVILAYPFMEAIAVHRMAHELYRRQVALMPRMMTEWAHSRTGIDLHPGAQIGSHFFIDHGTGTVVGETCQIGNHVKMYHGVTLGARSTSDVEQLRGKKRHPTIEDHVTIYPGATILGGDTIIGEGSTIGGNVFLMHSVPRHSLVISEDVRIKVTNKKERQSNYLDFQI